MKRPAVGETIDTAIGYAILRIERALIDVRALHKANADKLRKLDGLRPLEMQRQAGALLTEIFAPLWAAFEDVKARLSGR